MKRMRQPARGTSLLEVPGHDRDHVGRTAGPGQKLQLSNLRQQQNALYRAEATFLANDIPTACVY